MVECSSFLTCYHDALVSLHRHSCLHDVFSSFLAENLQNLIFTHLGNGSCQPEDVSGSGLPRRAETFGGYDSSPSVSNKSKKGAIQRSSERRGSLRCFSVQTTR